MRPVGSSRSLGAAAAPAPAPAPAAAPAPSPAGPALAEATTHTGTTYTHQQHHTVSDACMWIGSSQSGGSRLKRKDRRQCRHVTRRHCPMTAPKDTHGTNTPTRAVKMAPKQTRTHPTLRPLRRAHTGERGSLCRPCRRYTAAAGLRLPPLCAYSVCAVSECETGGDSGPHGATPAQQRVCWQPSQHAGVAGHCAPVAVLSVNPPPSNGCTLCLMPHAKVRGAETAGKRTGGGRFRWASLHGSFASMKRGDKQDEIHPCYNVDIV